MAEQKKSIVVAVPCEDYEPEKVYQAVRAGVGALGGFGAGDDGEAVLGIALGGLGGAAPRVPTTSTVQEQSLKIPDFLKR